MFATPRDEDELFARASALTGRSIDDVARECGMPAIETGNRTKGKVGGLVEHVLGATGGSAATWDFLELRVELKTIPMDARGVPRESTFVCTVSLTDAEHAEWATSWARAKLSRILWVPVITALDGERRHFGAPTLWSPSVAQEQVLADDFEEILGRIGAGEIESLNGRIGRWLQLRPKAAHGRVRTFVRGADGEMIATVPRGFYLRALFTGTILKEPLGKAGIVRIV